MVRDPSASERGARDAGAPGIAWQPRSAVQSVPRSRHTDKHQAHHAYRSTASERRPSRRGHVPHISISDTNHHVTEAIGGMYGSDEEEFPSPKSAKGRPLSFLPTSQDAYSHDSWFEKRSSPPRSPHGSSPLQDRIVVRGSSRDHESMRKTSLSNVEEQRSPPLLSRRSSSQENTAVQSFPLNNIDYESSPAAVAQELSNLQAIRRMSMNVNMADPDLPSFGGFGPAIDPPAPHSDDEGDAARLFWVPARVHPELAPKEFKTFIEDRVDRLKHRSDDGTLLPETIERKNSEGGGINRKKSMLSRQIKSDKGYEDGAARLERKRSEAGGEHPTANLAELETLVNDPSSLIRTMSIDDSRTSQDSGIGVLEEDDKPLMGGLASGLKRSTRTAYRRGSLRKGERAGGLRRGIGRAGDAENETQSAQSSPHVGEDEAIQGISRVQTDPIPTATSTFEPAENFSRPGRRARLGGASNPAEEQSRHSAHHGISRRSEDSGGRPSQDVERASLHVRPRVSAEGRTSPGPPSPQLPVPHIVETPPPPEAKPATYLFPERKSSMLQREQIAQGQLQQSSGYGQQQMRPQGPLIQGARTKHLSDKSQTSLDDLSSNPSPVPGMGASRTDEMTMVPTFENLKKVEDKSSRKTSWGWLNKDKAKDKSDKELQRNREKEQEREREAQRLREKEEKDKERDSKLRKPKVSSKLAGQDKTRLDVLQTSIDGGASRGRESLVLNREDIKLEEERRKESTRKKGEDGKKEKDNGLLSALFGGGKRSKSSDHDNAKKRLSNRSLSPEPPPRVLRPDVDYNWTRFSILEERAIYRMAHIKLANPKRALYSQVLLSNFMYSYLAKVQLMHPQMQVAGAGGPGTHGQGAAASKQKGQKKAANNGQQSGDESMDEFDQYRRWQEAQTHPDGPAEQPQAAETGSLGRPRNNDGRGVNPQNRGMNGAGGHRAAPAGYGGSAAVGGAAAGAVGGGVTAAAANTPPVEQDYSTAYLGYGKQQLLEQGFDYDDDEGDSWSSGRDSNMFAGLS